MFYNASPELECVSCVRTFVEIEVMYYIKYWLVTALIHGLMLLMLLIESASE